MPARRSALIIEVPNAEPAVASARLRLDKMASLGVPAHVTALFPFVSAAEVDQACLSRAVSVVAKVEPFGYRFSRTDWFEKGVVFLAPDDPAPFSRLTRLLWDEFPECPPYGGQFPDPAPHLTIGQGVDLEALRQGEAEVLSHGPVVGQADRLTLLVERADGRWAPQGWFLFGPSGGFVPNDAWSGRSSR